MHIEHEIMENIVRLASGGRRRLHRKPKSGAPKCCGYGRILDLLCENDGLSQREIAETLGIRPQSASEAISSMESQCLVHKQVNEQDRRSWLVYITREGRERQIARRNERMDIARKIFEPLTDAEKITLLQLLNKAASALQENKEEY